MTSIAGITIQAASAGIAQSAPVSATTANTANTPIASTTNASVTAQATSSASASPQNATISPQIVVDPVAGVITKYLDGSGKIVSQFPSSVAVAYLRAGLDAQGFRLHPDTTSSSSAQTGKLA